MDSPFSRKYTVRATAALPGSLGGREVDDATRYCYGHAFVLLAAAAACKSGVEGASEFLAEISDLLEARFWQVGDGLYVDVIASGDWRTIDPYRGQNANMHMCEAMLSAFEATGQEEYLDRAHLLAKRICVDLAAKAGGLIWEHYKTDWSHDWEYNADDPKDLFRPYGYLPGHFAEWAKLLLILERYRPEAWMVERARGLFDVALAKSWDHERGGMHYTFAPDGRILDTDRYYWVLSETFAAAALLALRTDEPVYWSWYDKAWEFSDRCFVRSRIRWLVPHPERGQSQVRRCEEPSFQNGLPSVGGLLRDPGGPAARRRLTPTWPGSGHDDPC